MNKTHKTFKDKGAVQFMNLWDSLDDRMKGVIQKAIETWRAKNVTNLNIEHLLYIMILDDMPIIKNTFEHFGINTKEIIDDIEKNCFAPEHKNSSQESFKMFKIKMDVSFKECIGEAYRFISRYGNNDRLITPDHFFMAMCTVDSSKLYTYLNNLGISPEVIKNYLTSLPDTDLVNDSVEDINPDKDSIIGKDTGGGGVDTLDPSDAHKVNKQQLTHMKPKGSKKTPTLDQYSTNMIELVKTGKITKVIGRDKETEVLMEILCRKNKRNALLIGDAGVGKTSIVEGLAIKIYNGEVPLELRNKRLLQLDVTGIVSGTVYRGMFEERMKYIVEELVTAQNAIVFIDEAHLIIGAGNGIGGMDVSNILKPALARGDIQLIAATTQDEYSKYLAKDKALERRFQTIQVDEPTMEQAEEILFGIKDVFEKYHNISVTDDAIKACVRLSKEYIPAKFLPDKAIDALDSAGARTKMKTIEVPENITKLRDKIKEIRILKDEAASSANTQLSAKYYKQEVELVNDLKAAEDKYYGSLKEAPVIIDEGSVADIISKLTGIPSAKLTQKDAERLLSFEDIIKQHIVGQRDAISSVCRAIRRARTDGLKDPKKPIGSFLFMGATGVGKTELAKQISIELFGKEDNLLKFDMSEYAERFDVAKLLGSAPGFVGYDDESGKLSSRVRKTPYAVVLFDEIEKAHPDIYNVFLQIMEDGVVTDGKGRQVYFNNCILIFTSNIGAKKAFNYNGEFGFANDDANTEESKMKEIKKIMKRECDDYFRPEFLNRLTDIIVFNRLTKDEVRQITDLEIGKLNKRLEHRNIDISISDSLRDHIIDKGYDVKFGARPIKRAIANIVEDHLAEKLLKNIYHNDMHIDLNYDKDKDEVSSTGNDK